MSAQVPMFFGLFAPYSVSLPAALFGMVGGLASTVVLALTLPCDRSFVNFGTYSLHYGTARAGLPTFLEVRCH